MNTLVVDTSAILTAFDEAHPDHRSIVSAYSRGNPLLVVSPLIVAEADYMLSSRLGPPAARQFARDIVSGAYELAEWTAEDHATALNVTNQFGAGKDYTGMADASNVVLADRYRTTSIVTLDQRHFRQLVPLWGATAFTVLPYDSER